MALGTAAASYLAWTRRKKALGALALGTLLFAAAAPDVRGNFAAWRTRDETTSERLRYWRDSLPLIKERPLLGHGPNTFHSIFMSRSPSGEEYRGYAHNFIVQLWSDLGLAGLFIFLFGFYWVYRKPPPVSGWAAGLWTGLLAFWIQGLFDTNFFAFQTSHLFWAWWGVLNSRPEPHNRA